MWKKGLRSMNHAPEVDVHYPFEVADGLFGGSSGEVDPGIVDDHVDRAVEVSSRVGPGKNCGTIGDVDRSGSDLDPVLFTHANGVSESNRIEVCQRKRSASRRQVDG